ncbi:hypothetical protein QCA50_019769 [Cerrena zonata]|uniref:Uncharacterized protein n=1 Tax=Cerrena zonata TaxID=2478898 RepID=A0AAW0FI27_9APHY
MDCWLGARDLFISLTPGPCVAFVAFNCNVEYEVHDRTSPTLTYISATVDESYELLKTAFTHMFDSSDLLPNGGYLDFGLGRKHDLGRPYSELGSLEKKLKRSGALLWKVCKDLPMDVSFRVLYADNNDDDYYNVFACQRYDIQLAYRSGDQPLEYIAGYSGSLRVSGGHLTDITIEWVVGEIKYGFFTEMFGWYHDGEPDMRQIDGYVCLMVVVGRYGNRKNTETNEHLEKPDASDSETSS